MSRRAGGTDNGANGAGGDSVMDLSASISQLQKQNTKLERMMLKMNTAADNASFRDMITSERKSATHLTRQIIAHIKTWRSRGPLVKSFEKEYQKFLQLIEDIDTKQKQQILAVSQKQQNPLADQLMEEEVRAGRSDSLAQTHLPSEQEVEFIAYNVDEVESRHVQIKAIEKDVREVAEMFKDLQTIVDDQQVGIDVIDNNVHTTHREVQRANLELEQAAMYQNRARKKKCFILIVLLLALAVAILIALGVTKKLTG